MHSRWNEQDVAGIAHNPVAMRVYTSRLLGQDSSLVLHGGGNTSVKIREVNLFGREEDILYVKGSGWDLATIEAPGFAPVRMETLLQMAKLKTLSDTDMVTHQRAAMTHPNAPTPSVEAILHAIIPFRYVDHTHADAVVTITNTPDGEKRVRDLYGNDILIVPYVMPGFILARTIHDLTRDLDWSTLRGMVLLNHGVFSFSDDARQSYEAMIDIVSEAEAYLRERVSLPACEAVTPAGRAMELAQIRREVARLRGAPMLARWDTSPEALAFARLPNGIDLATRGPLTPDHVLRTKPTAARVDDDRPAAGITEFGEAYTAYFQRNAATSDAELRMLDPAPRWALWPGKGVLYFGSTPKDVSIVADIVAHTMRAIRTAQALGEWTPLAEADIFEMEYWELEQAKLRRSGAAPALQGNVALVTGAASGIGRACVMALREAGAAVVALDIQPDILEMTTDPGVLGQICDVTDPTSIRRAISMATEHFGGLDLLISNAGSFPSSAPLAEVDEATWSDSLALNLSSHQRVLQAAYPFLQEGMDPAVVIMGSKNVPAPGPGASAYSVAKAGLNQLARLAALEWAPVGIRVNTLHPNAVFDTGIWTPEVLDARARHYGMTVEAYKTNNLLRIEVTSRDVARAAVALLGPTFSRSTGLQIAIDGGNDRVI